jgi:hypothetical protein
MGLTSSKRKSATPSVLPIKIKKFGQEYSQADVLLEDHPAPVCLPWYPMPGLLNGKATEDWEAIPLDFWRK